MPNISLASKYHVGQYGSRIEGDWIETKLWGRYKVEADINGGFNIRTQNIVQRMINYCAEKLDQGDEYWTTNYPILIENVSQKEGVNKFLKKVVVECYEMIETVNNNDIPTLYQVRSTAEKVFYTAIENQFQKTAPSSTCSEKVKEIKYQLKGQLAKFEEWASRSDWKRFHRRNEHYDWWAFPVEKSSLGYGEKYAISRQDVAQLKKDPEFMRQYRRGVILTVRAWGWDLEKGAFDSNGQQWSGPVVRLGKISDSLHLLGEKNLHKNLKFFYNNHLDQLQGKVSSSDRVWLDKTFR